MRRELVVASLLFAFAGAASCSRVRPLRFADRDPIEEVSDDQPIPMPKRQVTSPLTYANAFGRRPVVTGLDLTRFADALDVNALDEVPTSSWFVHPAGGPLGAVENVVNGPPEPPFLVLQRRPESGRSGLVVIDARGLRYELGRDAKDRPFLRTTAAVVASHLMRAVGYRTPEVSIIGLYESQLRVESVNGAPLPTLAVRAFLDDGPPAENGLYRVSATRWPIGIDLGATPEKPRDDDPNDRVPHEDRRTLRALSTIRAWLRCPDFGLMTLRDVYVGPEGEGHLEHFVVGLEGALGADDARGEAVEPRSVDPDDNPTAGESPFDLLATLGLHARTRAGDPRYPFIGDFDEIVKEGDSGSIGFEPTHRLLPADRYWMAKQMAAVSRDVIEAAVRSAAPADEATSARLIEVLESRRRTVIAEAYAEVTPCEVVRAEAHEVVLRDAGFTSETAGQTRYEIALVDSEGDPIGVPIVIAPGSAVFTIGLPSAPYVLLRVRVVRGDVVAKRSFDLHFTLRNGALRLVGARH